MRRWVGLIALLPVAVGCARPPAPPPAPTTLCQGVAPDAASLRALKAGGPVAAPESQPVETAADVDGDGKPDRIITFGWCLAPVIVMPSAGGDPVLAPMAEPPTWTYGGASRVDRIEDVNGDGKPELVVEYRQAGASADHHFLYIYQWRDGALVTLFHDDLTDWVGANHWAVAPGTVQVQCHPFGPYEYKMTFHRQQTEHYRGSGADGRYLLAERSMTPASTRLQQVAAAERLFQAGRYGEAAEAYRAVPAMPEAVDEAKQADWLAYSHFRLGQMAALAGRSAEALAELERAQAGREPIAGLAGTFRQAYTGGDAAAGFAAAWEWVIAHAYAKPDRSSVTDAWPVGFDPPTVGARAAMLEAFRQAERKPPADLPAAQAFPEPDCLTINW